MFAARRIGCIVGLADILSLGASRHEEGRFLGRSSVLQFRILAWLPSQTLRSEKCVYRFARRLSQACFQFQARSYKLLAVNYLH